MDMNSLLNRLEKERVIHEHPEAVAKFLQETEYLRERPVRGRFSDGKRKIELPSPALAFGVLAILVVVIRML